MSKKKENCCQPNQKTIKALKEQDEMKTNKKKYPRYSSLSEALKESNE